MSEWLGTTLHVIAVGIGATLVMDLWLFILVRLNIPTLNFAFVGRWVGHLARGTWRHESIGKSEPIRGELALGWVVHYATGIALAACMVAVFEIDSTGVPTLLQALLIGIVSVFAPLFIMQPAMGAGLASAKTPQPWRNRMKSLATHSVFGAGLYVSAHLVAMVSQLR